MGEEGGQDYSLVRKGEGGGIETSLVKKWSDNLMNTFDFYLILSLYDILRAMHLKSLRLKYGF